MSNWLPYLIAIVIGLLVGIERERANPNQKAMGVRTFLFICLLGAIAGGLQEFWISFLLAAFALGLIFISYFKTSDIDRGLTTEFAAAIIFCLGYAAHKSPALSAVIGPIVALVLFSKTALHRFTRAIKHPELEAALLLLLGGVVVISLVPDTVVDSWGIFNPKKFGYLILTLATLEFSSYVLVKIIGEKKGSLILGFLGGFVSSTAVMLSSARQSAKAPKAWRTFLSSALIAKLAALLELLLIVGLVSPTLFTHLIVPVGAGVLCGIISLIIVMPKGCEEHNPKMSLRSPLEWKGVLRLSFLLGFILASVSLAKFWIGDGAIFAVSLLTGLFELHGVSLANAIMHSQEKLNTEIATISVMLAIFSSLAAKIVIAWIINHGVFVRVLTMVFLIMMVATGLTAWLTLV